MLHFIRESNVKISLAGADISLLPVAMELDFITQSAVHQIMISILKYTEINMDKSAHNIVIFFPLCKRGQNHDHSIQYDASMINT